MTHYAACLLSTFLDPYGWASFLIGLAFAVGLARRGRGTLSLISVLLGAVVGALLAAFHYNLNCVELYPG
ncbi:hypothetical protein ACTTAI_14190 [Rhodobacter capsulatus]|uniref:hypothetical protein n=1 Tax=Rhodobacter capsulatus TaxID=1061 RepID=UPI004024D81E